VVEVASVEVEFVGVAVAAVSVALPCTAGSVLVPVDFGLEGSCSRSHAFVCRRRGKLRRGRVRLEGRYRQWTLSP